MGITFHLLLGLSSAHKFSSFMKANEFPGGISKNGYELAITQQHTDPPVFEAAVIDQLTTVLDPDVWVVHPLLQPTNVVIAGKVSHKLKVSDTVSWL